MIAYGRVIATLDVRKDGPESTKTEILAIRMWSNRVSARDLSRPDHTVINND